jgi:hypothetical protein
METDVTTAGNRSPASLVLDTLKKCNKEWIVQINECLPVVLYSCETWVLALREDHILRTGCWGGGRTRLHNEELQNLYASPTAVRVIKPRRARWAGHIACMGDTRKAYTILDRNIDGKRPLWRSRRRWNGIRMDGREIWLKGCGLEHCGAVWLPWNSDRSYDFLRVINK